MELAVAGMLAGLVCILAGLTLYSIKRNNRWFITGAILAASTILIQVAIRLL
jgi:hypothetical protein